MLVAVKVFVVVMSAPAARYSPVRVQDHVRPGQVQQVRVASDVLRVIAASRSPR